MKKKKKKEDQSISVLTNISSDSDNKGNYL